jgi:hypothetical protein
MLKDGPHQVFSFRDVGSHTLGVLLFSSLPNFGVGGYTGKTSRKIWEVVDLKKGECASFFAVGYIDRYLPGSLARFGTIVATAKLGGEACHVIGFSQWTVAVFAD